MIELTVNPIERTATTTRYPRSVIEPISDSEKPRWEFIDGVLVFFIPKRFIGSTQFRGDPNALEPSIKHLFSVVPILVGIGAWILFRGGD